MWRLASLLVPVSLVRLVPASLVLLMAVVALLLAPASLVVLAVASLPLPVPTAVTRTPVGAVWLHDRSCHRLDLPSVRTAGWLR